MVNYVAQREATGISNRECWRMGKISFSDKKKFNLDVRYAVYPTFLFPTV